MLHPEQNEGRIARKLILYLVLASALITLLITAYQLYRDYAYDLSQIDKRFEQITYVYQKPLSHALWATDVVEVQLQIDGMMRLPDMQYIAVYENEQLVLSSGEKRAENVIAQRIPLTYEHRGVERTIGQIEVVATLEGVYWRLIDKVWVILVSNGIKTFIIAGFFLYIFQHFVARHLRHLAEQFRSIDTAALNQPVRLARLANPAGKQDELDVLVHAFDVMRTRIAEGFDNLRRREENLRLYETIMATTTDMMSYVDRNYIYRAVNSAYTSMYGKTTEQIIGTSIADLLGDEMFQSVSKPNLDRVFSGKHVAIMTSLTNKLGEKIDAEVNYYPYYGASDEVQGAVINVRDISERVQAEEDQLRNARVYETLAQQGAIEYHEFLRNCLSLLRDVFQSRYAFVGHLLPDKLHVQTECVLAGDSQLDNFVYELAGSPCGELFEQRNIFIYDSVAEKFPRDTMLVDMQAQTYFGVVLVDTNNNMLGVLAVLDTNTHQPQSWHKRTLSVFAARIALEMERADVLRKLEHYNEALEQQVEARTNELQNSIRELETFSYSVSHDLRAPLRAINGFGRILYEDFLDQLGDEGVEYLNKIIANTDRMSVLIDSLLRLSRISRQNMEMEPVDLSWMCEHIVRNNYELVLRDNLQLDIQPGLVAWCDAKLMRIALENLLDNAIKYSSRESAPVIRVGMKQEGKQPVFYVYDNGVGFDTKYHERLFQPFQRLHGEEFSGTGIGLATVQRIVLRHNGSIWAESTPQQGTWFYFTLQGNPAAQVNGQAAQA